MCSRWISRRPSAPKQRSTAQSFNERKRRPSAGPYSDSAYASSGVRRYSGTSENACRNSSGLEVQRSEQSAGTSSHLCGLTTSESASSTPSCDHRSSSQIHAEPAYAASTCSQAPAACARSASSLTGSTEANEVVPTVATTAATSSSGTSPCMRCSPSASTLRSSRSSIRAAFSTEECACSEQTTTFRP